MSRNDHFSTGQLRVKRIRLRVEHATRVAASATRRGERRCASACAQAVLPASWFRQVAEPATRAACFTQILAAILSAVPASAHACSACMGDVNSKSAGAMNAAIFLMLGVIGSMLAGLGAFAFYLSRRAAAPAPPHAELGASIDETDDLT